MYVYNICPLELYQATSWKGACKETDTLYGLVRVQRTYKIHTYMSRTLRMCILECPRVYICTGVCVYVCTTCPYNLGSVIAEKDVMNTRIWASISRAPLWQHWQLQQNLLRPSPEWDLTIVSANECVRVSSQIQFLIRNTELASLSTDMCSTKPVKATPYLLIVLDSDTDYAGKGGTEEDLVYRCPGGWGTA